MSELYTWATNGLLTKLEQNPRERIQDLSKMLDVPSTKISQGIELLNEFGFTEKFTP